MAIAIRGSPVYLDVHNATGGTAFANVPVGTLATDILIAMWGRNSTTTFTTTTVAAPAGWTRIGAFLNGGTGVTWVELDAFWALGNVASLSFTLTGAFDTGGVLMAFSGVDNVTPIDVTGTAQTLNGSQTLSLPSIAIATANAWELIAMTDWNAGTLTDGGSVFVSNSNPHVNCQASLLTNSTPFGIGGTGAVVITNSVSGTGQVLNGIAFALRPTGGASSSSSSSSSLSSSSSSSSFSSSSSSSSSFSSSSSSSSAGAKGLTYDNQLLNLIFNATPIPNIADNATVSVLTTLYFSLHSGNPAGGNQSTNEAAYAGYARTPVARTSGGFVVTANSVSPAANVIFNTCTSGSETELFFGIGTNLSGTGTLLYYGSISSAINVIQSTAPFLPTTTVITEI